MLQFRLIFSERINLSVVSRIVGYPVYVYNENDFVFKKSKEKEREKYCDSN